MTTPKKKIIKAYAVMCNNQEFLIGHWDFAGAVRQMEDIKIGTHEKGLSCSHKVVPCFITYDSLPQKKGK